MKYSDIDYSVYTDAAGYLANGGSPYDRHTYRYTPLLAYMMVLAFGPQGLTILKSMGSMDSVESMDSFN